MSTSKALEAVLEELVLSVKVPTVETIQQWISRYPQYREDICEFVSEWMLQERLPEFKNPLDEATLAARAITNMQAEMLRRDDIQQPLRGIFAQAQAIGMRLEATAAELGVNVQLLDLLDRKRVRVETIPERFLAALAARIHVSTRRLVGWLSEGTPAFVPASQLGAHSYKVPVTFSFESAWRQSGLVDSDLKAWTKPLNAAPE